MFITAVIRGCSLITILIQIPSSLSGIVFVFIDYLSEGPLHCCQQTVYETIIQKWKKELANLMNMFTVMPKYCWIKHQRYRGFLHNCYRNMDSFIFPCGNEEAFHSLQILSRYVFYSGFTWHTKFYIYTDL